MTPACLSIDCVCAFCTSVDDGRKVVKVMEEGTPRDEDPTKHVPIKMRFPDSSPLRFGVPDKSYLSFCGPGGLHVEERMYWPLSSVYSVLLQMDCWSFSIQTSWQLMLNHIKVPCRPTGGMKFGH